MRPDITNAIAFLLLLRTGVKRPVSALFVKAYRALTAIFSAAYSRAAAKKSVLKGSYRAMKGRYSFSVNFQPV